MRKFWFPGLVGLLVLILAACGSSATAVPAAKQAPAAPAAAAQPAAPAAVAAPAAPAAAAQPAAPAAVAAPTGLAAYAAKYAGGVGAIYLGDLKQLVGPAPTKDQGDFDGNVPLESLQRHLYIYESDYYKGLLAKAKLTNPTPLVSSGQSITIQHACINRALLPCKMSDSYFFPNVLARTNGQVKLVTSSFPELGLAGPDTLRLVTDGTLSMADIYGGYVGGDLPAIEIQVLWGMFPNKETEFRATAAITPDLEKLVVAATGGGQLINHNWYSGNDQVFITKKPLRTAADFKGLKTRSHSTALSDWIQGMGATAQVVSFAETYAALERGILEAAVSGADAAFGQRWYEVAKYINWGLESFPSTNNVINGKVWAKIPPDLQQIIIEEGAKSELEALRVAAIQNEMGVLKNTKAGLELVEFSPELKDRSRNEAFFKNVLPGWIKRVGGGNAAIITGVFNPKVGPLVGLRIEPDGSVTKLGAPAAKAAPAPAAPAAVAAPPSALAKYAADHAGKPGAIYVGDIKQLVGLAATKEEGGLEGEVPLDALTRHLYIYDSPYYKGILEKANLANPTKLVTTGAKISIQHTCINRTLLHCAIVASFWAPNLEKRTNGQLKLTISSLPELGLGGPDTLRLVQDGTLAMADVYSGFVAGDLPAIEIQSLWGMFPDQRAQYEVTVAVTPDLEKLVKDATGGSFIINHNWVAGIDQFFFCNTKIKTLADFKGKKTRSHGTAISDWIEGMGASAQFVPFGDVYTALERGILDCGVTGATPAHGQRWYEVSKYINGPLVSFFNTNNVINKDVWNKIPADLQQIMIEEGAKSELEGMRLASIQNETGVLKLQKAGMELVEFSQELKDYSYNNAVLGRVLPNWVKRVGGPDSPWVKIFNEKASPIVGLRIEPNGSVAKVPVTKVR